MRKIITVLIILMLSGCYATDNKDAAFIIKKAVPAESEFGAVLLKCLAGREGTCPDKVPDGDVMISRIVKSALMHSDDIRAIQRAYGTLVYNLPADYTGCALVDVTINRTKKTLKSEAEITRDKIISSICRINVFQPLPARKCWSDSYAATGYNYMEMKTKENGSKIINMNSVNWGNTDVVY